MLSLILERATPDSASGTSTNLVFILTITTLGSLILDRLRAAFVEPLWPPLLVPLPTIPHPFEI